MKNYTIGIQGTQGCFHHQVAQEYFGGKIDYIECDRFRDLTQKVKDQQVDFGIIALENSIAGTLLSNYLLIVSFELEIIGEYFLNIEHHLLVQPGVKLTDLKEVHSHRIAIEQCESFFTKYPYIKLVDASDTAWAAKKIKEDSLTHVGAIGSKKAAEIYQLDMLCSGIQTIQNNQTRFAIIGQKSHTPKSQINKVSTYITLKDERGSLYQLLKILNHHDINITKLQSIPLIQQPWSYAFIIDFEIKTYEGYMEILQQISFVSESIKVLGEYTAQKKKK